MTKFIIIGFTLGIIVLFVGIRTKKKVFYLAAGFLILMAFALIVALFFALDTM